MSSPTNTVTIKKKKNGLQLFWSCATLLLLLARSFSGLWRSTLLLIDLGATNTEAWEEMFTPLSQLDDTKNFSDNILPPPSSSSSSSPSVKAKANTTLSATLLQHSPLCNPTLPTQPIRRIVFGHMRKAAGTSIHHYLTQIFRREYFPHVQIVHAEAGNVEDPDTRRDTLYVTHLRDPVARAVSHYKFSGRWNCPWIIGKKRPPTANWTPTADNGRSMERFIRDASKCIYPFKLWDCVYNCYTTWLNLPYKRCVNQEYHIQNSSLYHRALDKASRFHLIIQAELLQKDRAYAQAVEDYFGVPGLVGLRVNAQCDAVTRDANRRYPPTITNASLDLLRRRNAVDYDLFNQLSTCPNGVHFPQGSVAEIVRAG